MTSADLWHLISNNKSESPISLVSNNHQIAKGKTTSSLSYLNCRRSTSNLDALSSPYQNCAMSAQNQI